MGREMIRRVRPKWWVRAHLGWRWGWRNEVAWKPKMMVLGEVIRLRIVPIGED